MQAEEPNTVDVLIMNRFGSVYVGMTPDVNMIELVNCPFTFSVGHIYVVPIDEFTITLNKDSGYTWTYSKGIVRAPAFSRCIDDSSSEGCMEQVVPRRGFIKNRNLSFVAQQQIITNTYKEKPRDVMLEWYDIQTENRAVRTLPLVPFKCKDDDTDDLETRFMQMNNEHKKYQISPTVRRGCFLGNCKVYSTFSYESRGVRGTGYKLQFWNDAILEMGTFFNNQKLPDINFLLPAGKEAACAIRYTVEQGEEKKGYGGHFISIKIDSVIVVPEQKFHTLANFTSDELDRFISSPQAKGIREIIADMKAYDQQDFSWQTFYYIYNPEMYHDNFVTMECVKVSVTNSDVQSLKHSIQYGPGDKDVLDITNADVLGKEGLPSLVRVWQNRLFYSAPWTCDYADGDLTSETRFALMNQAQEVQKEQEPQDTQEITQEQEIKKEE